MARVAFATLLLFLLVLSSVAAQTAGCEFVLGFAALRVQLGADRVGDCLEDQVTLENGDARQRTTTGELVWRKADGITAFTDGNRTWLVGPNGLEDRLNTDRLTWEMQTPAAPPVASPSTPSLLSVAVTVQNEIMVKGSGRSQNLTIVVSRSGQPEPEAVVTIKTSNGETVTAFPSGPDGRTYAGWNPTLDTEGVRDLIVTAVGRDGATGTARARYAVVAAASQPGQPSSASTSGSKLTPSLDARCVNIASDLASEMAPQVGSAATGWRLAQIQLCRMIADDLGAPGVDCYEPAVRELVRDTAIMAANVAERGFRARLELCLRSLP